MKDAYVADVNRLQIFKRDRLICHICGKKTDPRKSAPHPKAPTIDHVIPLARGGTHEPSNVRLACRSCNCGKAHRGGGEQFALDITI
jgi:5-methylcytosine-specific restriction endonuclease McrA